MLPGWLNSELAILAHFKASDDTVGEVPLLVTSLGATSMALGVIAPAAGAVLTAYGG